MSNWVSDRLEIFRKIRKHPVAAAIAGLWALISFYDTFGFELLPPDWAQKRPSVYQLVMMTSGWISGQAWLLIGAAGLAFFAIEYSARHSTKQEQLATGSNSSFYARIAGLAFLSILIVGCFGYYAIWPARTYIPSIIAAPAPAPAVATSPAEKAKPKPHYSADEIDFMIGTLRHLNQIIQKEIYPAYSSASDMRQRWNLEVNARPKELAVKLRALTENFNRGWIDMINLLNDPATHQYWEEIYPVVGDERNSLGSYGGVTQELADNLAELSGAGVSADKYTRDKFTACDSFTIQAGNWLGQSQNRIEKKTKELRDWTNG